jgi:excisionase family DNA binding protein
MASTTGPDSLPTEKEILTIEDLAAYLRLKPQTIYRWAQGNRIPAAKLGKEWRFRRSIIDRWLDEQMLAGNPEFEHLKGQR